MFLALSNIPYSMYSLLVDRMSVVNESYSHRPDRIVKDYYGQDLSIEAFCNEASNVSALTAETGTEYFLPSQLFLRYFKEV